MQSRVRQVLGGVECRRAPRFKDEERDAARTAAAGPAWPPEVRYRRAFFLMAPICAGEGQQPCG